MFKYLKFEYSESLSNQSRRKGLNEFLIHLSKRLVDLSFSYLSFISETSGNNFDLVLWFLAFGLGFYRQFDRAHFGQETKHSLVT